MIILHIQTPGQGIQRFEYEFPDVFEKIRRTLARVPHKTQKNGVVTYAWLLEVRDACGNILPEFNFPL